jgi:hypothetical protein
MVCGLSRASQIKPFISGEVAGQIADPIDKGGTLHAENGSSKTGKPPATLRLAGTGTRIIRRPYHFMDEQLRLH